MGEAQAAVSGVTVAWIALVVSIGALFLSTYRWCIGRRRNRILGDPAVARSAIVNARDRFQEIVSLGGKDKDFFTSEANRSIDQALRDAAGRRPDKRLRGQLEAIAAQWGKAYGHAPTSQVTIFRAAVPLSPPEISENLKRDRRRDLEVMAAEAGLDLCAEASARLNELDQTL